MAPFMRARTALPTYLPPSLLLSSAFILYSLCLLPLPRKQPPFNTFPSPPKTNVTLVVWEETRQGQGQGHGGCVVVAAGMAGGRQCGCFEQTPPPLGSAV